MFLLSWLQQRRSELERHYLCYLFSIISVLFLSVLSQPREPSPQQVLSWLCPQRLLSQRLSSLLQPFLSRFSRPIPSRPSRLRPWRLLAFLARSWRRSIALALPSPLPVSQARAFSFRVRLWSSVPALLSHAFLVLWRELEPWLSPGRVSAAPPYPYELSQQGLSLHLLFVFEPSLLQLSQPRLSL